MKPNVNSIFLFHPIFQGFRSVYLFCIIQILSVTLKINIANRNYGGKSTLVSHPHIALHIPNYETYIIIILHNYEHRQEHINTNKISILLARLMGVKHNTILIVKQFIPTILQCILRRNSKHHKAMSITFNNTEHSKH